MVYYNLGGFIQSSTTKQTITFVDNFNRPDSLTVDNDWTLVHSAGAESFTPMQIKSYALYQDRAAGSSGTQDSISRTKENYDVTNYPMELSFVYSHGAPENGTCVEVTIGLPAITLYLRINHAGITGNPHTGFLYVNGIQIGSVFDLGYIFTTGSHNCKFYFANDALYCRFWVVGNAEPVTWNQTISYGALRPTTVGNTFSFNSFIFDGGSAGWVTYDDISITQNK